MALYAIILAGGAGTRFWPASRVARPKQLLPLVGQEALLAATVRRIADLVPPERVLVSTGAHLLEATAEVLPRVPRENLLAEPAPRNTAPCIAWATARALREDPNATCMVLPSDHFIGDEREYAACVARALDGARRGFLTTLGIRPTRPETGYGYIEIGADLGGGVHEGVRFVEKPNREQAEIYLREGKYLWNAGMFFYDARLMMDAVRQHLPAVAEAVAAIDEAARKGQEAEALAGLFPSMPSISIDHGVMEKERRIAVVPGSFGWSDLGSWQSAWELSGKDGDGNVLPEGGVAIEAANNLVWDARRAAGTQKRVYALVGVSDLVVVETDDAVLVVPRERAQDVRLAVEALRAKAPKLL